MDSGQNTSEPVKRGRKRTIRSDERKNLSGGSAGAGGVDFQAEASGLIGAKILAREGLTWVDAPGDRIPETISAETGTEGMIFGYICLADSLSSSNQRRASNEETNCGNR